MRTRRAWAWIGVFCFVSAASLRADTLFLRDGRRVDGQLIAVRDGTIEFDVQRGIFGRDRVRISQSEVLRIEFDQGRPGDSFGGNNNNRNGGNGGNDGGFGGNGNGNGGGRPSGMRERVVTVPAGTAWRDAGLTVRSGQTIYVSARGRVRWGPGRQDGPEGERSSPRNDARPMPGRPAAALIGRIGEGDEFFFIGDDEGPIRIRGNGRLYLGINDDYLQDNSGSFQVTVYY
jgi:hypothetical protein